MTEKLFELRRRTFDTPRFRGIEFIEVEAKSILNKVSGERLPFNWTINPYRGCSHACVYCVGPETMVLMGDGRAKAIAEIAVGDEVYGTRRKGNYRRYVKTTVQAHWRTIKPGYKLVLEDDTEIIASGDHRFLSNRGWKHVIGKEHGPLQRPFLTTNNKLIGLGGFTQAPKHDQEYRRGYLTGMIRGDGLLFEKEYVRPNGGRWTSHQFRLALIDREALNRSKDFLEQEGVDTTEFVFQRPTAESQVIHAIRTQQRAAVQHVRKIIRLPERPVDSWRKGFLAGLFDAEGSMSDGIFRVCNTDPLIAEVFTEGLRRFGYRFVVEERRCESGKLMQVVRLVGGWREKLRFFHQTDPSILRKRSLEGLALKSDAKLKIVEIMDLGVDLPMFDITTGTGDFIADGVVSHNCFARSTHTFLDMDAGKDFESKIVVKVNAPELLRKELRAKRWKGEKIAMGTATDPYQRAEGRYRIMPRIIGTLTEYRNPFSILTKGTLILRDIEMLAEAAQLMDVTAAFSIGTLDEEVWRRSEPGTPHPRKRMDAVKKLNAAGIPTGVLIAPILPGISDKREQIRAVVDACIDAGATHIYPILLHLRPKVREVYMGWLSETYPDLVSLHEDMYRRGAYAPKNDQAAVSVEVREAIAANPDGMQKSKLPSWRETRKPQTIAASNEQMSLL